MMKKIVITSTITVACMILVAFIIAKIAANNDVTPHITVGFVYEGDESTPYSYNFIRVQRLIEAQYGNQVKVIVKSNTNDESIDSVLNELCDEGCDLIFTTSYGFGEGAKRAAESHPDIQFCQATCSNANEDPVLPNYHNFMGEIYQGRYLAGLVAGLKLQELISDGKIDPNNVKIGYVGAYPYAEVISGYTAFFLGIRQYVPTATMTVKYSYSWNNYAVEKEYAEELIEEGCVVISQHSDTIGPAVACEDADVDHPVIHVGYNQSMIDFAPTTSLISCRINWIPYMLGAVDAVLYGYNIESHVDAHIHGNDASAGFDKDWVQMVELNTSICAKGTQEMMESVIEDFKKGKIEVFKGEYTGTNPYDPSDTIDLRDGFTENETTSAPMFCYVLDDVITIEE